MNTQTQSIRHLWRLVPCNFKLQSAWPIIMCALWSSLQWTTFRICFQAFRRCICKQEKQQQQQLTWWTVIRCDVRKDAYIRRSFYCVQALAEKTKKNNSHTHTLTHTPTTNKNVSLIDMCWDCGECDTTINNTHVVFHSHWLFCHMIWWKYSNLSSQHLPNTPGTQKRKGENGNVRTRNDVVEKQQIQYELLLVDSPMIWYHWYM